VLDLRTQRTSALHGGGAGDWSPDARRIVFTESGGMFTMSARGNDVRPLAPR
jgi:hypothetical protein